MMRMTRLSSACLAVMLVGMLALAGCSPAEKPASQEPAAPPEAATPAPMKIGTLATQDALPLWVAEEQGYFSQQGLADVEVITFQSAQECQAAFTAGEVDALMTDIMVAANLHASGTKVRLATVMLGATAEEGRFAIVAAPGSGLDSMTDLKGVAVGTASNTITEYVLDELVKQAGMADGDVNKEEVKKMPIRYQLLMSGQLKAASLPEPFITLAEQSGAKIVEGGDDTESATNISSSVLAVNAEYADSPEGAASVKALLGAWDLAVSDINASPDDFRSTLIDGARLPKPLENTFEVSTYPKAQAPSAEQIQSVLDWMKLRGYLSTEVTPSELLGK